MVRTRERVVDELLVLSAQGHDVRAFELLAARWHPRLLRHAARLTGDADGARDVVQDAWVAIARGLGRLADSAAFGAWALRITDRRCADWIAGRQRMRQRFAPLEAAAGVPAATEENAGDIARVRDAIKSLGRKERALLAMHYVDDLSLGEIAGALGVPVGTVKSRLYHARERLRVILEARDDEQARR
jgi:RNA polymerase sigma factor (sigma-70 family)